MLESTKNSNQQVYISPLHGSGKFHFLTDLKTYLILILCIFTLHGIYFGSYVFDDSAISLSYARNFAEGYGFVLSPGGERVEGYSNFLWVILLALYYKTGLGFLGPMFIVKLTGLIFGLASIITLFYLARVAYDADRQEPIWLFGPFALAVSTPFVLWSVAGLETPLYSFLILLSLYLYLQEIKNSKSWPWSALVLGLVAITRPEGVIYFITICFHRLLCMLVQRRFLSFKDISWGLVFVVFYGIFLVWRLNYFSYWLPNTYYAKASDREISELWYYIIDFNDKGWYYIISYFKDQYLAFFLVFIIIAILQWKYWLVNSLFVSIIASTLLYIIYVGGDWWFEYRFISPIIPVIVLLISQGLFSLKSLLKGKNLVFSLLIVVTLFITVVPNIRASIIIHALPDEEMVGMWTVAERGLKFKAYAEMAHIQNAKYLEPDMGGSSFFSDLKMVDLALLADIHLARFKYYPLFFKQYIFDEQRPDFIHTHDGWTSWSGITTYDEFWESYLPIEQYQDEDGINGDFVRKDLFVIDDVAQIQHPLNLEFSELRMLGFEPDTPLAYPDQTFSFTWYWQCKTKCQKDYSFIFEIKAADEQNSVMTEYKSVFGWYPTSHWQDGEIIKVKQDLKIPPHLTEETYKIFVGVTDGETKEYQSAGELQVSYEAAQRLASENYAEVLQFLETSEWESALEHIELALRLDPSNQQYQLEANKVKDEIQAIVIDHTAQMFAQGDYETAATLLIQAQSIKPLPDKGQDIQNELSHNFFLQGQQNFDQHQYEQAFYNFKKALEINPANAWARHKLEDTRVKLYYIDYYVDTEQFDLLYQTFMEEKDVGNLPQDLPHLEKLYWGLGNLADETTLEYLRGKILAYTANEVNQTLIQDQDSVTQEIHYIAPQANEVFLVWGIDGWNTVPKDHQPEGTIVTDSVMYTPMNYEDGIYVVELKVPVDTTIDYGFLITQLNDGTETKIWEADDQVSPIVATSNGVIDVESQLASAQPELTAPVTNIGILAIIGFIVVLALSTVLVFRRKSLLINLPYLFDTSRIIYLRDLLRELVTRDMKLRYKRSALGIFWSLLNPLAQLLVFIFVFTVVLPLNIPNYPLFVFTGLLVWTWFQSALFQATDSIVANPDLVRRPGFPMPVLPVVTITTHLIHFLLAIPILLVFLLWGQSPITGALLFLPVLIVLQFLLTLSLSYTTAALQVNYRDVQYLLGIILTLAFFMTPIFYDASAIPENYQWLYNLNPITQLVTAYRTIFLYGEIPNLLPLVIIGVASTALLFVSYKVFIRTSYRFVEEL